MGDHTTIIYDEFAKCQECGDLERLRPFGRDSAWVCITCAMKDQEETLKHLKAILEAGPLVIFQGKKKD